MTTILICAGGTGGHVIPALSVAAVLRQKHCDVHWLGTRQGIEARLVPQASIPVHWVRVQGLRGKGFFSWLLAPYRLLIALWDAWLALDAIKPDVVLGMGGFVAGPGGLMAKFKGIPLVIHEQNARPGLTNRTLAKVATVVTEAFDQSFARRNVILVGNPVRDEIKALPDKVLSPSAPFKVLIIGGSQGAAILNRLMPDIVQRIDSSIRPQIRHQSGRGRDQSLRDSYAALHVQAEVIEFIQDMAAAYHWADLVVARAGALTVTEVAASGVPAIFIPFPAAVDDHQSFNARWLVNLGGALMVPESTLAIGQFADVLTELFQAPARLRAMCNRGRSAVQGDSQQRLAELCLQQVKVAA